MNCDMQMVLVELLILISLWIRASTDLVEAVQVHEPWVKDLPDKWAFIQRVSEGLDNGGLVLREDSCPLGLVCRSGGAAENLD